jgi:hypothetical protein
MNNRLRLGIIAAGMCLAGAVMVAPASAATPMSSGGGCSPSGEPLRACIYASGSKISSSVEIASVHSGCTSARQYITDLTIGRSFGYPLPCSAANYAARTINGTNGHYYETVIKLFYSGGYEEAVSPELYFSD